MTSTSYRVELATTARAGCNNMECKDAGIKIQKNELRLGTWVEIRDYGGWQWKHWGCVTGKQLENMRNYLEDGKGGYMWDKLDGYNDGGKGSLDDHPEMQEKVRRVVTQGFIDPEDWKGDPEMNTLGKSGTRTVESKKKFKEQKSADMGSLTEIQAKWDEALREKELLVKDGKENGMKLKALNKKIEEFSKEMDRRRKEEEKQKAYRESSAVKAESANTPKKRSRVKKEDIDEEEQEDEKPVRKKRGGKVKKEEDSEEEVLPIKKARGKRVAVEKEEEEAAKPVPVKESRAKKPVIKKGVKEEDDDEDEILTKSAPAAKKGRKNSKKVKEEPKSETPDLVSDDDTSKNQKAEPLDEEMKDEEDEEEVKPVKKTRG